MPSVAPSYLIEISTSASTVPEYVWDAWRAHARDSNVMLPHAENARHQESTGHKSNGIWISCATSTAYRAPAVDFVLSCTAGSLGSYPLFIFTPLPLDELDNDYVYPRLLALADALRTAVPVERVFSVFAPETITRLFVSIWTEITGVPLAPSAEYYAAKISYCTKQSLRPRSISLLPGVEYDLRLAMEEDTLQVAELCYGFAVESEPFVLSKEGAISEASILIRKRQLWVHEIHAHGQPSEIASIVAFTRTSETVASITKVYTNPRWRKRGCAERLTRKVCKHLLKTKESVVLYVAHNNPAAAKVYHRVGFVGLEPQAEKVSGVDSWLELGFDRRRVVLGHW